MSELFAFVSHDSNSSFHEKLIFCQFSSHLLNKSALFHQVAESTLDSLVTDGLTHLIEVIHFSDDM
jgi:hypothetical protein